MMILMQTVPPHIDPKKIESELIKLAKDEYEVIAVVSFVFFIDLHYYSDHNQYSPLTRVDPVR